MVLSEGVMGIKLDLVEFLKSCSLLESDLGQGWKLSGSFVQAEGGRLLGSKKCANSSHWIYVLVSSINKLVNYKIPNLI